MTHDPNADSGWSKWLETQGGHFDQTPGWSHPRLRPSSKRRPTVHQLKVTLKDVRPPVWRRVVIPSSSRLDEVANYLIGAMGWTNSHLHAFFIGDRRYDMALPDAEDNELDESDFTLREVFDAAGSTMRFEYDFGDGWEHDVLLEAVRIAKASETEPYCIGGRRACPPEDCGGTYGYAELLNLRKHGPETEWDRERLEWLGDDFDPEAFDPGEASDDMLRSFTYEDFDF